MTTSRTLRIHGHVQGVSFRYSARSEARRLGLTGSARNDADGSVWIEVEGEDHSVEQFVAWCRTGPPGARVERLDVEPGTPRGVAGFSIG